MGIQVKPRKDIVILAVAIEAFCILLFLWNILTIFCSIFVGNTDLIPLYVFQWIFTGVALFFPIIGIIGALRILLSLIIIFIIFLLCFIAWLILFVIILFAIDHSEHVVNYVINPISIGVNMLISGVLLLLCLLFTLRVLQYRSNIE